MAYKNQKKNKQHTAKLNKDHNNWRNVKRRKRNVIDARNELKGFGLTESQIEAFLVRQGLISVEERGHF